jgi:hypothetical protein
MKVSIDKNQLGETKVMLSGLKVNGPKILARSLNKTATYGRKRVNQEIRKKASLKLAYINGKLSIKPPATWTRLKVKISAEKRGVLMTHFTHTMLKRGGATVKIKPGAGRVKFQKAFKTTVKAGGKKVEVLAIKVPGKYATGSQKFNVIYGPSVSQLFDGIRDNVDRELLEYIDLDVDKQISAALRGY